MACRGTMVLHLNNLGLLQYLSGGIVEPIWTEVENASINDDGNARRTAHLSEYPFDIACATGSPLVAQLRPRTT